jgi:hypothetical protein
MIIGIPYNKKNMLPLVEGIMVELPSEQVVFSLLCVQCNPLLRKAVFTQTFEKYHMALDQ